MTDYLEELFRRQRAAQRPSMPIGEADDYGRFGDTLLAHISKAEAQKLKSEGGAGTRNPTTGLLEFFDAAGAGGPGPGEGGMGGGPGGAGPGQGGSSGPGGAAGGGAGGGGGGEAARGADPRSGPGVAGTDVGGAVGSGAAPGPAASTGASGNPGGIGVDADSGPQGAVAPETEKSFFDSLAENLDLDITDLAEGLLGVFGALSPTIGAVTGPLGLGIAAHDTALGLGKAATALGVAGDPGPLDPDDPSSFGSSDPGAVTGSDPAAFGGKGGAAGGPAGAGQITDPPPPPPPGPEPIPILDEPASLRLSSAMTPLQKRATIATFGTGAESGRFREPDVQNFYKNFLLRNLLANPEGGPLPVENQFMNQILGLDVSTDTPRSELLSLLGNPAAPTPAAVPPTPARTLAEGLTPGQQRYA